MTINPNSDELQTYKKLCIELQEEIILQNILIRKYEETLQEQKKLIEKQGFLITDLKIQLYKENN